MNDEKCEKCFFFYMEGQPPNIDRVCRRYPPVLQIAIPMAIPERIVGPGGGHHRTTRIGGIQSNYSFPAVDPGMWCGEYKPIPGAT